MPARHHRLVLNGAGVSGSRESQYAMEVREDSCTDTRKSTGSDLWFDRISSYLARKLNDPYNIDCIMVTSYKIFVVWPWNEDALISIKTPNYPDTQQCPYLGAGSTPDERLNSQSQNYTWSEKKLSITIERYDKKKQKKKLVHEP